MKNEDVVINVFRLFVYLFLSLSHKGKNNTQSKKLK